MGDRLFRTTEISNKLRRLPPVRLREAVAAADTVDDALAAFTANPTEVTLRVLNGAWAAAQRLYTTISEPGALAAPTEPPGVA